MKTSHMMTSHEMTSRLKSKNTNLAVILIPSSRLSVHFCFYTVFQFSFHRLVHVQSKWLDAWSDYEPSLSFELIQGTLQIDIIDSQHFTYPFLLLRNNVVITHDLNWIKNDELDFDYRGGWNVEWTTSQHKKMAATNRCWHLSVPISSLFSNTKNCNLWCHFFKLQGFHS